MLSVSALKLYRMLIKNSKGVSVKGEIIRHTMLCLILTIPMIIASFIETFVSSSLICMYH